MHVHRNQFDQNLQLNTFYAAAKAEAKMEAQRTRKKLLSFGALLDSEDDGSEGVIKLGARERHSEQGRDRSHRIRVLRTDNRKNLKLEANHFRIMHD
jgi:hypothetical protein